MVKNNHIKLKKAWDQARCPRCEWRRRLIKQDPNATDAPPWTCETSHPEILRMLHHPPCALWRRIIETDTLCSPSSLLRRFPRKPPVLWWDSVSESDPEASPFPWIRIPLRCVSDVCPSDCTYAYEGESKEKNQIVTGFHNTRLESLVQATAGGHGEEKGILVDKRLRFGKGRHRGNSGVNVYADGGLETFGGCPGWCSLELTCVNTTSLKGGRAHRYCVNGPFGEICYKVAIKALWVPWDEVPAVVRVAWATQDFGAGWISPLELTQSVHYLASYDRISYDLTQGLYSSRFSSISDCGFPWLIIKWLSSLNRSSTTIVPDSGSA